MLWIRSYIVRSPIRFVRSNAETESEITALDLSDSVLARSLRVSFSRCIFHYGSKNRVQRLNYEWICLESVSVRYLKKNPFPIFVWNWYRRGTLRPRLQSLFVKVPAVRYVNVYLTFALIWYRTDFFQFQIMALLIFEDRFFKSNEL